MYGGPWFSASYFYGPAKAPFAHLGGFLKHGETYIKSRVPGKPACGGVREAWEMSQSMGRPPQAFGPGCWPRRESVNLRMGPGCLPHPKFRAMSICLSPVQQCAKISEKYLHTGSQSEFCLAGFGPRSLGQCRRVRQSPCPPCLRSAYPAPPSSGDKPSLPPSPQCCLWHQLLNYGLMYQHW